MDGGHIYKSHYEGWYCVADEAFVPESQVTEKNDPGKTKISTESGHPVEWSSEENYMFKLNSMMSDVLHWIKEGKQRTQSNIIRFEEIIFKVKSTFLT